jgi:hypothetical protein
LQELKLRKKIGDVFFFVSIISKFSVEEERHVQLVGVCTLHQGVILVGKSKGLLLHHRHIHVGANNLSQSHLLQVGNLDRKTNIFKSQTTKKPYSGSRLL